MWCVYLENGGMGKEGEGEFSKISRSFSGVNPALSHKLDANSHIDALETDITCCHFTAVKWPKCGPAHDW